MCITFRNDMLRDAFCIRLRDNEIFSNVEEPLVVLNCRAAMVET